MTITITLADELVAQMENGATKQHLSVEQYAITILKAAMEESDSITPQKAVTNIQATAPNPSQVRAATANLAYVLRTAPEDPSFDLASWNRQWSGVNK